ncbi:hypothetical protein [Telluribacter humicola]|uniref:hypothetical protein n=1 Tax=Telluribacter humicola TaxID=1720261 RepID=UPI001A957ABB|nr:hypothetical protein [Telluribacter humicola]
MSKFHIRKFFYFIGISLTFIILISITLLFIEYATGNADGVWKDIDIRKITYQLIAILVLATIILHLLFYSPEPLRNYLFSLSIFCFLLVLLEGISYLLFTANKAPVPLTAPQPFIRPDWTGSFVNDDILGVRAKKSWSLTWAPVKDGVQYDSITVSTDENSLRKTAKVIDSTATDKHALFFGCSYTYGDGVSDNETLPYQFQLNMPQYRAYNLGFLAYSPLHMLARLQHEDLTLLTEKKKGFAVYTFIHDQIDRTIPATRWIDMTKGRFPYLNKEAMTTHGVYSENKRLYSDFIQWFRTTYIHHVFRLDFPKKHAAEHYQLVVNVIKKSKQEYQKQFGNNGFYVIIFPGSPIKPEMKQMLQNADLTVFDYSHLFNLNDYLLPFDNAHPNANAYKLVASQLAKDIAELEERSTIDR